MQEIHLGIEILEFDVHSGGFSTVFAGTMYIDINASAKQIFENFIEQPLDLKSKFFIMKVQGTLNDELAYNFYTIITNNYGDIKSIKKIKPPKLK